MTTDHSPSDATTLARIDERTISLQLDQSAMKADMRRLGDTVEELGENLRGDIKTAALISKADAITESTKYVTKAEFQPVKAVAYGIVGFAAIAVLGAVVAQVITTGGG